LGCAALVFCWQFLTIHANYQDHWNALFCTGARLPQPPQLSGEQIYVFTNSYGYDGQVYHYIAHDPFFQRGFARYVDQPRFRYQRILVPLAAFALALGRQEWVDGAYFAVVLLAVFCGAAWLSAWFISLGFHPAWGLSFLLIPATLVSIDRLTVDVALAALAVAFVLYIARAAPWSLYLVLMAAPLVRDTGFLLVAGYVAYCLWMRKIRSGLFFATAVIPTLAWDLFVRAHTKAYALGISFVPLQGIVRRFLHPVSYPFAPWAGRLVDAFDYLALAGIAIGMGLALRMAWRRMTGPVEITLYLFTLLAVFLSLPGVWVDAYSFGRAFSPLLVLLALDGISKRNWMSALPLLMVTLRVGIQLGPQTLGILRWLA
jgi:hypothetical protein